MKRLVWWTARVWALPYTLIGLLVGMVALLSGGRMRAHTGVCEFSGGIVPRLLDLLPIPNVQAITFGHTVLGRDERALNVTRRHERVHVRQFERWGPLMGIAYVGCSTVLWCRGRDYYRENPFERQAYAEDHAESQCTV